jgi:hypothetical protein
MDRKYQEFIDSTGEKDPYADTESETYDTVWRIQQDHPELFDKFSEWARERVFSELDPHEQPNWVSMEKAGVVKPDQWLVHFTNSPWYIARDGFEYGHEEEQGLAYTTHKKNRTKGPGYNFAFKAGSRDASFKASKKTYGKEAVMFRCGAIETYHNGDDENQVIFWGPDAKDIVPIYDAGGDWQVIDNRTERPLFTSEIFDTVVDWVERNFDQYRKALLARK